MKATLVPFPERVTTRDGVGSTHCGAGKNSIAWRDISTIDASGTQ